jgi:hypothetical protein
VTACRHIRAPGDTLPKIALLWIWPSQMQVGCRQGSTPGYGEGSNPSTKSSRSYFQTPMGPEPGPMMDSIHGALGGHMALTKGFQLRRDWYGPRTNTFRGSQMLREQRYTSHECQLFHFPYPVSLNVCAHNCFVLLLLHRLLPPACIFKILWKMHQLLTLYDTEHSAGSVGSAT